ncbi:MAG TPA: ferric reductase-like transmembrane domain-containing protein, partial [Dehalococcoidales bacterium]|nr:ferric reductase-like transmembrane domain-containing protein [Dehalococcoidales bacterium]
DYSLILLVLSLACTPLANIFGIKTILNLRRPLGLYGFFYAWWHLMNFIGLDYRFDFTLLWKDVSAKAYIWVGLVALLLLIPAAVTSTRGWMRRLGKNWERLHWLVYPAALLSMLHFLLLVKADIRVPVLYGIIVALLLLLRMKWIKNTFARLRL